MRRKTAVFAVLSALLLVPVEAAAVELYQEGCNEVPCPVVVTQPAPVVHVVTQPTVVEVEEYELVEKTVVVEQEVVKVKKARPKVSVEVDGGVGMWIVPKLKEKVNLAYDVRLSLLVKDVIMTVSFNWVPEVEWDCDLYEESFTRKGDLALVGMGFGYRWNKLGHIHPEIGVKFDALALARNEGKTVYAFGVGAAAGLMADFPLPFGAIMAGVMAEGHYHAWHQEGFFPPRATAAVMGLAGYKF